MYDELVKRLRTMADWAGISFFEESENVRYNLSEAADAIEELKKLANEIPHVCECCVGCEVESGGCDIAFVLSPKRAIEYLSKPRWIPVTERLPENDAHVLLSCKCGAGAYVCDGFHTEKFSTPTQFYEDIDADYDEDTDEYYFPEGWWEVIKNWDDYSCVAIEDTVTHWMPLPEPPKEEV